MKSKKELRRFIQSQRSLENYAGLPLDGARVIDTAILFNNSGVGQIEFVEARCALEIRAAASRPK